MFMIDKRLLSPSVIDEESIPVSPRKIVKCSESGDEFDWYHVHLDN